MSVEMGNIAPVSHELIVPFDVARDLIPDSTPSIPEQALASQLEAPYLFNESRLLDIFIEPQVLEQYAAVNDIKDADVITIDGQKNLYTSIGTVRGVTQDEILPETWQVGRFIQRENGVYDLQPPVNFSGGNLTRPCAPAMAKDNFGGQERMLMALHTDCFTAGNAVQMFESTDGQNFEFIEDLLSPEEGIGKYDPEISELNGRKILTYVRYDTNVTERTEIHGAELILEADGKYTAQDLGVILRQEDLGIHNQKGEEDFEWGIEAWKLMEVPFPDGTRKIVGTGVTFQKSKDLYGNHRERETRQRFTMAIFDNIGEKPSWVGYLAMPQGIGENGHGFWDGEQAVFQERLKGGNWGLRVVDLSPEAIQQVSAPSLILAA